MNKRIAQDAKPLRAKFLNQIQEAKSLVELEKIKLLNAKAADWLQSFDRPNGLSDKHYCQIRLLLTQVRELRRQRDFLANRVELLSEYYSPLREEADNEPCPIKEAELNRKADEDEAVKNRERRTKQPLNVLISALAANKTYKWKSRDKRRHLRPRTALWHEPMTIMDFRDATGLSRRTLQNMLKRLSARPLTARKRRNEPEHYGQNVNHSVLCRWLTHDIKDQSARRGLLARTLARCKYETPERYEKLVRSVNPVVRSLNEMLEDFLNYVEKCKEIIYPALPTSQSPDFFAATDLRTRFPMSK